MAGKPAAYVTSGTQHAPVAGAGSPDVLVDGHPAWAAGDVSVCAQHGPEAVNMGSETVLINKKRAARATEFLLGGGPPNQIMVGAADVLIGGPDPSTFDKDKYCTRYCAFKAEWDACKTPDERRAAYQSLLNDLAAKFGSPGPHINEGVSGAALASWDRTNWTVNIGKDSFQEGGHRPGPWATAHEMRHCEQTFSAMRASGDTSVTKNKDAQAAAAAQPPDPNSQDGRYGALHAANEISPAGNQNRDAIINEENAAYAAMTDAKAKYGASSPEATAASDRFSAALQAYKDQPGGQEGFAVDDVLGDCGCGA